MNLHAIPWAVMGATLFALAVVIYRRQSASRVAVLFCAMITLVAVWFACFAAMLSTTHAYVAAGWGRVALGAVCILPAVIYDFTATALRISSKRSAIVLGIWIIAWILAGIALMSKGLV